MKSLHLAKLAVVAATMLTAASCGAANLAVTAAITSECAVTQNTAIAFGTLTLLSATGLSSVDSKATGSVDAVCTNGTTAMTFKYTSAHTTGSDFRMIGGTTATEFIAYTLHQDADASTAAVAYNTDAAYPGFVADGTVKNLNLTGKIVPSDRNGKSKQSYSDTITVTVTFS